MALASLPTSIPCCACLLAVLAAPAAAEEKPDDPAPVPASAEGVGAAVLPGLVLHGTGLWVRGDKRGARNLLTLEGVGLGIAAVSGSILGLSGASRRVSNKTIPFLVSGSALFVQTWLADIYGSAGGGRRRATPRMQTPPLTLELGAFYVRDDQFEYGPFTRLAARWTREPVQVASELAIGLGEGNQRVIAEVSYRFWGPRGRRPSGDSSFFEAEVSGRSHRYGREDFIASSGEVVGRGRLDARRLGRSLAGSFADLEVGFGLEATRYTSANSTDLNDQLLVRFAYGLYIGNDSSPVHGELSVYYDHRRDEFAGGLAPGDLAAGFLGFFGLGLDLDIGSRFGVVASAEAGSAQVVSLSLKTRWGSPR